MATAGYSGKSLAAKLGFKPGQRLLVVDGPAHLDALLADAPALTRLARVAPFDAGWIFVTRKSDLARHLSRALPHLAEGGMIWVSWPKKASGVSTDMTEDEIRAQALPLGLVDIKVCAVDEVWSGLKLTRRRASR
jgi:hypothetical protein